MADKNLVHQNGDRLFVTSLDISNRFGKRHDDVLKAVRNLDCSPEFGRRNFAESSYNNSQNKAQPLFEITRDGFVFLCMGFTGPQAALWKERYIVAFNEMEAALRQPAPLPAVAHSPRLEASVARMSQSVDTLAQGMNTVLTQLNVTNKYISLLELNQQTKARITPTIRRQCREMAAEGIPKADIGRLLRISRTSVSLICSDQYPESKITDAPPETMGDRLEAWIERERERVSGTLAGIEGEQS